MDGCACCGGEFRRLRRYQKNYGDESSEVLVCANCFSDAVSLSKDILDNAGAISFLFAKGEKRVKFPTSDGREITLEIK